MKVIDYAIVTGQQEFVAQGAKSAIETGWQPFGTLIVDNGQYSQAIVKYEEAPLPQLNQQEKEIVTTGSIELKDKEAVEEFLKNAQ